MDKTSFSRRKVLKGLGAAGIASLGSGCLNSFFVNDSEIPPELEESMQNVEEELENELQKYDEIIDTDKKISVVALSQETQDETTYTVGPIVTLADPYKDIVEDIYLKTAEKRDETRILESVKEPAYEMFNTTLEEFENNYNAEKGNIDQYEIIFQGSNDCSIKQRLDAETAEEIHGSDREKQKYMETFESQDKKPFFTCSIDH